MRKIASFSRWSLVMWAACGLAMSLVADRTARAESISITITGPGFSIPVDALITGGATPTFYGNVDITTLNTLLSTDGSSLQFSALGGSSNWSGATSGGILSLTGGISNVFGSSGTNSLTITETEMGFNTPIGSSGALFSSSTGNYNNAGPGNFHTADSSFNAVTTPSYTLSSTISGPDPTTGSAMAPIPSFSTPYTLVNTIHFKLPTLGADDSFGVTAKATAIPEPASVVTMLIGLPLPLVGLAWLRRRRTIQQGS